MDYYCVEWINLPLNGRGGEQWWAVVGIVFNF